LSLKYLHALLFCLPLSSCTATPQLGCPYEGEPDFAFAAGCLAVVHGKVLVVDSRTGGLTPPGGKSREGESAQCAAHRETLEETGLSLIPGKLLTVFDTGFHLYACAIHPDSGQIAPAVMEVRRSFWLDLASFDSVQWRYPGQQNILRDILMSNVSADTSDTQAD
jgi:8-oxo-dGTP diphosphatase